MDSTQPSGQVAGPPGERPDAPEGEGRAGSGERPLREAMLTAIGELSEDERERLSSAEQPGEVAGVWRDLIAERAAREREQRVRAELTREFESQVRSAQQRPTSGLHGSAPPAEPSSVREWTDLIHSADSPALRQQRRSQFAQWLAAHPEA